MLTEADIERRRHAHGGHDAAAIAGLHPFLTPLDVYRRHTEPDYAPKVSEIMEEGNIFERPILELYAKRTGATLLDGGFRQHPRVPWAIANLDAEATRDGTRRVVDAKHPSPFSRRQWGDGDDAVPEYVLVQQNWYLGVLDYALADVAVHFGAGTLAVYTLRADHELFELLLEQVAKFRRDHIEPRRPPPVDDSESCARWISDRFPKPTGDILVGTPVADEWVDEYRRAQVELDAATQRRDLAKNRLKEAIGDARGISGSDWKVTWGYTKGQVRTDWEAVATHLRADEELVRRHTSIRPGHRTFRLAGAKGNSDE